MVRMVFRDPLVVGEGTDPGLTAAVARRIRPHLGWCCREDPASLEIAQSTAEKFHRRRRNRPVSAIEGNSFS